MIDPFHRLSSFLSELKRRKVYRVGVVYAAVAFVLVLAWAFEVTPEGVQRTAPVSELSPDAGSGGERTRPGARGFRGVAVLVGAGLLLSGVAGWWLLASDEEVDVDVSTIRSVAVLPLDNFSGDAGQEPFVAGMHDELINQLSRVGALLVTSRTSVMRYRTDSLRSLRDRPGASRRIGTPQRRGPRGGRRGPRGPDSRGEPASRQHP